VSRQHSGRWACRSGDARGKASREADRREGGNGAPAQTCVAEVARPEGLGVRCSSRGINTIRREQKQGILGNAKIGRDQENSGGNAGKGFLIGFTCSGLFVISETAVNSPSGQRFRKVGNDGCESADLSVICWLSLVRRRFAWGLSGSVTGKEAALGPQGKRRA
jgi:hypothetical protein